MVKFVSLFASGVSLGAVLAIVALGFLVLYNATGIINFAHGYLATLGAYLALWAITVLQMPTISGKLRVYAIWHFGDVMAALPRTRRPLQRPDMRFFL